MNINLSHPDLDLRRKKKLILAQLHRVNWLKITELDGEWVWVAIESEPEFQTFARWIAQQPIEYPIEVNSFDPQWHEISQFLALNEFDLADVFKTTGAMSIVAHNMQWIIEYSNINTARFGTIDIV
jgi:hypothetical protein